jgi:hypothetical protein
MILKNGRLTILFLTVCKVLGSNILYVGLGLIVTMMSGWMSLPLITHRMCLCNISMLTMSEDRHQSLVGRYVV